MTKSLVMKVMKHYLPFSSIPLTFEFIYHNKETNVSGLLLNILSCFINLYRSILTYGDESYA